MWFSGDWNKTPSNMKTVMVNIIVQQEVKQKSSSSLKNKMSSTMIFEDVIFHIY